MLGTEKPFISIGERKMRNREKKKALFDHNSQGEKKNEVALSPLLEAHLIMEACTEPQTEKKKKVPSNLFTGEKKRHFRGPVKRKVKKKKGTNVKRKSIKKNSCLLSI